MVENLATHLITDLCFWQEKENNQESNHVESCYYVEIAVKLHRRVQNQGSQLIHHERRKPVDSAPYSNRHTYGAKEKSDGVLSARHLKPRLEL